MNFMQESLPTHLVQFRRCKLLITLLLQIFCLCTSNLIDWFWWRRWEGVYGQPIPQSVWNCTTRIPAHTRIALHHEVLIQSKMILTCVRTLNKLWAPANAVKGLKAQHRNEINGDCTLVHWYMDNTALVTRGPESCKKKHSNSQENLLRKRGL